MLWLESRDTHTDGELATSDSRLVNYIASWGCVIHLSAAGWATITPFTGASQSSTYINSSADGLVLLKLLLTQVGSLALLC